MNLILGSSSKYRQQILREQGYDFTIISPDIDEKAIRDADPHKLVLLLAAAKAEAILPKLTEPAIVITADQVVDWRGQIREKPASPEQAREFLHGYAEAPATTVSGIQVINTANGKRANGVDRATIYFSAIPEAVIDALIEKGDIFHHSGGFAIEESILQPYITKIEGPKDSVWGMPITLLQRLIEQVQ